MRITDILIVGGIAGIAVAVYFFLKPKPVVVPEFTRPTPTNAYFPDPDINEWSYKNSIRQDYEAMTRLETHPYNDIGGWNVGNIHPSYEDYLQKKYF